MPPFDDAMPPWPDDAVEVGRIVGAWGLKGWLKVQPFASEPKALFASRRWFVRSAEATAAVGKPAGTALPPALLRVVEAKEHGDGVVARVRGVDDRASAEALRGVRLFVPRASFPTPSDDEFYWVDLIGLDVVNREGAALGRVIGLLDTGPHSVLRLVPSGLAEVAESAERLVPFVAAIVDRVDMPARRIVVDWGLDY